MINILNLFELKSAPVRTLIISTILISASALSHSREYFQQEVNFRINVSLNDVTHELSASETIQYINNSPDTLSFLLFHLWPDAYSGNNTPLARQLKLINGKQRLFSDPATRGYIDSLDFIVDGEQTIWKRFSENPDICKIELNNKLLPGDTIYISTPFRVKIPGELVSRFGHSGDYYQITQWYPKPAVYDKDGWHEMSYLHIAEFYSEFGSFDVSITVPGNYIVGASGELQDAGEIALLDNLAALLSQKGILLPGDYPSAKGTKKTLRFTAENMHDFAWFACPRFQVGKSEIKLSGSGKELTAWFLFTIPDSALGKEGLSYIRKSIEYFSDRIGDYPYKTYTAVLSAMNQGSGMEYPAMGLFGYSRDKYILEKLFAHEICHEWFYASIGTNERSFPFMDEGITTAFEMRYMQENEPGKKLWEYFFRKESAARFLKIDYMPAELLNEMEWLLQARNNLEIPLNLGTVHYDQQSYNTMLYNKASISFNYLRAYLGDSTFDAAIKKYYEEWKFRHPYPEDLRTVFESNAGRDLSWFFEDLMGSVKRLDYGIVRLKGDNILIRNNMELESPLLIYGMNLDSVIFQKTVEGFKGRKWIDIPAGNYTEVKIDPYHLTPELYRLNNNIRKSGIIPKSDQIRTQLYLTLEDIDKLNLMYIPAINWNREDGLMAGAAFHNGMLIPKRVEYFIMPFFSLRDKTLPGFAKIRINFLPYNILIRKISMNFEGTQFGAPVSRYYHRAGAGLDLHLRNRGSTGDAEHVIHAGYLAASDIQRIYSTRDEQINSYMQFGYSMNRLKQPNPLAASALLESGRNYTKINFEIKYKYAYFQKNKGIDTRLFAGGIIKNLAIPDVYLYSPSGRSGSQLYLYDGLFPDRFSSYPRNFWSRQMNITEGGLISPVSMKSGYNPMVFSLTLSANFPGKISFIPLKPFTDFVLADNVLSRSDFFAEAGLKTGIRDILEIYFPLLVTRNISKDFGTLKSRIRFTLDITSIRQMNFN